MKPSTNLTIAAVSKSPNYYPGDIVVTSGQNITSRAIRSGTCAPVSHALVMIDNESCIEAVGERVRKSNLSESLNLVKDAVLLRHKQLSYSQGVCIAEFLKQQLGKPYDMQGAIRSGVQVVVQATSTGLLQALTSNGKTIRSRPKSAMTHPFSVANW